MPCHYGEARQSNLVAMRIGHALAMRLPHCVRNEWLFPATFIFRTLAPYSPIMVGRF